ncbi:MAG: hypothetical protein ACR2PS_10835 [Pseudomonadales bacterium]
MAKDKIRHNDLSPSLPLDRAFVIQFGGETVPTRNLFEGRVEHINSGQAMHFQSLVELLEFVEQVFASVKNGPDDNT